MTRKRTYRKGMIFINKETKEKVIFGKWNNKDTASLISQSKMLLTLTREDLDNNYLSVSEMERDAREKRKGQCW